MTVTINRIQAIDLLKKVTKGKEDYKYQPPSKSLCVYVNTETPNGIPVASCLVGQALAEAGIPLTYLAWLDTLDGTETGAEDADGYKTEYGGTGILDFVGTPAIDGDVLILTDGAVSVFDIAQKEQDSGIVWGQAVEKAIRNGKGE